MEHAAGMIRLCLVLLGGVVWIHAGEMALRLARAYTELTHGIVAPAVSDRGLDGASMRDTGAHACRRIAHDGSRIRQLVRQHVALVDAGARAQAEREIEQS